MDSWSEDSVLEVVGTAGGGYTAPAGAVVAWKTSTIADTHRLRGRTFLVPTSDSVYDTAGQLSVDAAAAIQVAGAALIAAEATGFSIWHRPRVAKAATAYHPAVTARVGSSALVTTCSVSQTIGVLRSRRD